jgi:hypothetical protein
VPGAITTWGYAINLGVVTGNWYDGSVYHGFVRNGRGQFQTFDAQYSTQMNPWAINGSGMVAGDYLDTGDASHGFLRTPDGQVTSYDPYWREGPCSPTITISINASGRVTGFCYAAGVFGFTRTSVGLFQVFQLFGADTYARAINDSDTVTGWYSDSHTGLLHGFVRTTDNSITSFDAADNVSTYPNVINRNSVIAGTYVDSKNLTHGFLRSAKGKVTTFNAPKTLDLGVMGINEHSVIVGWFLDGTGAWHGFLRTP